MLASLGSIDKLKPHLQKAATLGQGGPAGFAGMPAAQAPTAADPSPSPLGAAVRTGSLPQVFAALAEDAYPQALIDDLSDEDADALDRLAANDEAGFTDLFDAQERALQRAFCSRERLMAIVRARSRSPLVTESRLAQ